ncbi:MAG: hypothetical protein P8Y78_02370 [Acidihalobacter sp.]
MQYEFLKRSVTGFVRDSVFAVLVGNRDAPEPLSLKCAKKEAAVGQAKKGTRARYGFISIAVALIRARNNKQNSKNKFLIARLDPDSAAVERRSRCIGCLGSQRPMAAVDPERSSVFFKEIVSYFSLF